MRTPRRWTILSLLLVVGIAQPALAFKPTTHLHLALLSIERILAVA